MPNRHGPRVAASLGALSHFVHYLGFAMAVGGSIAAYRVLKLADFVPGPTKTGLEAAASTVTTLIELPGLFIAVAGGIIAIVANPNVFSAAASGAGPWLHIKLVFVLGLLVVAHLRMFKTRRMVKERAAAASEAEIDKLRKAAQRFGLIDLGLTLVVFAIATFRFVLFAPA